MLEANKKEARARSERVMRRIMRRLRRFRRLALVGPLTAEKMTLDELIAVADGEPVP